ncbi:type VI secretion system baseplate subunit TssG [Cedecea sp.]|uniref:type VI secretion system baseplate subunit TssG n=1 Tax=Cedecea sp. TaxID=1970739 RepID=UPI002F421AA3
MPDTLDLLAELRREPWRYDFFSALNMIEQAFPQAQPFGSSGRLQDDPIRLGQHVSLAFEPAVVKQLTPVRDGLERLEVTFFGLVGPNAPMPLHLSEEALSRKHNHQDPSLVHFLDIFNHRLMTLLYRSWSQARKGSCIEDYLSALVGSPHLSPECGLAGEFIEQRRSKQGLRRLLLSAFDLRAEVTPLVRGWLALENEHCNRLNGSCLNGGNVLGARVCSAQHYFSLTLNLVDFSAYQRCLPGHPQLDLMIYLIRRYVGEAMQWHVNLMLPATQRPTLRLGAGLALGRESWLGQTTKAELWGYRFNPARFYP